MSKLNTALLALLASCGGTAEFAEALDASGAFAKADAGGAVGPDGGAAAIDAGREDGVVDAGREDGVIDAGREDGVVDAGREDGVVDAGREDGVVDAGRKDGGAAALDAGGSAADTGAVDAGPEAPGGTIGDYGFVYFLASTHTQIVRLQTTLIVPAKPPASGTLFLWPGLEPLRGSANFNPIGTGVLQPVLTWGSSCAPGHQPSAYSSWWISGQYVNTLGNATGYKGCYGGSVMSVNVGDELKCDMQLVGGKWNQTVTDVQTNKSVTFTEDLGGQGQNWAMFVIEEYSSAPVTPVIFNNTVITYAAADAADCKLGARGPRDFVSVPVASSDGLQCSVAQIILRAKGIQTPGPGAAAVEWGALTGGRRGDGGRPL